MGDGAFFGFSSAGFGGCRRESLVVDRQVGGVFLFGFCGSIKALRRLSNGLVSVFWLFFFGGRGVVGFGVVGEADAGVVFETGLAGDDDLVAGLDFG